MNHRRSATPTRGRIGCAPGNHADRRPSWPSPPGRWSRSRPPPKPPCRSRWRASTAAATTSANPTWGQAGLAYARVGPARYADGIGAAGGRPERPLASATASSTTSTRTSSPSAGSPSGAASGASSSTTPSGCATRRGDRDRANIPFNATDPLETFTNTLGVHPVHPVRAPRPAPASRNPRQQINTRELLHRRRSRLRRHQRAAGLAARRARWTATRPTTAPRLMLPGNYLPRARRPRQRGHRAGDGPSTAGCWPTRTTAVVAGDVRANENIALTATQTLFAREHNRIVGAAAEPRCRRRTSSRSPAGSSSPSSSTSPTSEFLPAMGVALPRVPRLQDRTSTRRCRNEFATVGYRAHSQIHGEFEVETDADRYTPGHAGRASRRRASRSPSTATRSTIAHPAQRGVLQPRPARSRSSSARCCTASAPSREYNNDEQIDNQLRSVLFQVPVAGNPECLDGPTLPACFTGVVDLGAIDIERGRDHGIRPTTSSAQAYGLPAKTSFTAITGEATEPFPADPR